MTDGVTINGNWSAPGASMAVVIAGLDCGNFTVGTDGSIFVPFGSDPNGLMTAGYLNSVSDPDSTNPSVVPITVTNGSGDTLTAYVPILVGYTYTSQGMPLRPVLDDQVKTPQGPGLGKTRRAHWLGALLTNAQGISFISTTGVALPAQLTDGGENLLTNDTLFSGVYAAPIDDNSSYDGIVGWIFTRPYPGVVNALTGFLETSER